MRGEPLSASMRRARAGPGVRSAGCGLCDGAPPQRNPPKRNPTIHQGPRHPPPAKADRGPNNPIGQFFLLFPDPGHLVRSVVPGQGWRSHREATRRRSALDAVPPTVTTIEGSGQSSPSSHTRRRPSQTPASGRVAALSRVWGDHGRGLARSAQECHGSDDTDRDEHQTGAVGRSESGHHRGGGIGADGPGYGYSGGRTDAK